MYGSLRHGIINVKERIAKIEFEYGNRVIMAADDLTSEIHGDQVLQVVSDWSEL
jgi:hypothetical protein